VIADIRHQRRHSVADWLYGVDGQAALIYDHDCFRDSNGNVIAWINGVNVYSLNGNHVGWFEQGVLYDSNNCALGFRRDSTGSLPSRPGIGGTPGTPGFGGRPGRPGFGGTPGKPGRGGWSQHQLMNYFDA